MEVKTEKQIDCLLNVTDKIGLIEHCRENKPDYNEGWCVDDNARGLQVALRYKLSKEIIDLYFDFLKKAWNGKIFRNDLNRNLTWKEDFLISGEHCGRALFALGEAIKNGYRKEESERLFNKIYLLIKENKDNFLRVIAETILGLQFYNADKIEFWAEKLVDIYNKEMDNKWKWFSSEITYDNGRLPMAMLVAYQKTEKERYFNVAIESLSFLTKLIFNKNKDCFSFPGNNGWFNKAGAKAEFGQQPIEAGSMVEVYVLAYEVTKNKKYKDLAEKAFEWFLGKNMLGIKMIDEITGGVYDGLEQNGANKNQGAESVLSYLIAAKEIEKLD